MGEENKGDAGDTSRNLGRFRESLRSPGDNMGRCGKCLGKPLENGDLGYNRGDYGDSLKMPGESWGNHMKTLKNTYKDLGRP